MVVSIQTGPLTYANLADCPDDGQRYEILGGELIVSPAPTTAHQRISRRLFRALDRWVSDNDAGEVLYAPVDVELGPHVVLQPDILFVSKNQAVIASEEYIQGPPDLVVEIFSGSTRRRDLVAKAVAYASAGVAEYWQIDPDRQTVAVLTLENGEYVANPNDELGRARSRVLSGFAIEPTTLFAADQSQ